MRDKPRAMNAGSMAVGAFLFIIGLGLWLEAPTFSLGGSVYFRGFGNGFWILTGVGIVLAALGAAILAWGVGTKE